jgi:hypothetical protein
MQSKRLDSKSCSDKNGQRLCIEAALRKKEGVLVFPLFAVSFFFP